MFVTQNIIGGIHWAGEHLHATGAALQARRRSAQQAKSSLCQARQDQTSQLDRTITENCKLNTEHILQNSSIEMGEVLPKISWYCSHNHGRCFCVHSYFVKDGTTYCLCLWSFETCHGVVSIPVGTLLLVPHEIRLDNDVHQLHNSS